MSVAIRVEDLSKAYQLGEIGTGTVSRDIERWLAKVRGKEDPFLKVGEVNDRSVKGTSNIVWSLKDISFEIEQGDAVGIIGRNGAGKSTLLKILSRVTTPTQGVVKARGRIASLLEVGTGFHPELTGRENIYLNGAILGMRKREITAKLDQIVDFSGVERYIDTPVKRYSSGMYVRLAFAVAAHLDSEILIVDEVLAVGDADFQAKCLGKMEDVSRGEGRTVLFVSHNTGSMVDLCKTGILLENGQMIMKDSIQSTVSKYISRTSSEGSYKGAPKADKPFIDEVRLLSDEEAGRNIFTNKERVNVDIRIDNLANQPRNLTASIIVNDQFQKPIFASHLNLDDAKKERLGLKAVIPGDLLLPGIYYLKVILHIPFVEFIDNDADLIKFEVEDEDKTEHSIYKVSNVGVINSKTQWHVQ